MIMNTFYDQFQHCMRHPQQRIVGVCSSCLQERLTSLIQPLSPPPSLARKGSSVHAHANLPSNVAETPPGNNADARQQRKATIGTHTDSTSTIVQHSHEDMRNLRTQALKQVRHSSDFANAANYASQNDHIHTDAKAASIPAACSTPFNKENRASHIPQHQQRDVSVSSKGDVLGKKRAPWFSASKSKNSSRMTSIQVDERKFSQCTLKSPQHASTSASQAVGSMSDKYRLTHVSDLEAIAEITVGDTTKMQNNINREAGMSTSWISNLFHRRRGARCRSNLSNSSGSSINNMDATSGNGTVVNELNHHSLPKDSSMDAARLSCNNGARPSFKQLLKRFEARSKQPRIDSSPSQFVDYAMKECSDNEHDTASQLGPYLQKSRSVASARSSISVEMPKDLMQSSFSPMIHQRQSNLMMGLEYESYFDDRNLRRSRSWGRTWNRALSPLWGSRCHVQHKATYDSPSSTHQIEHFRAGLVTPSHVNAKGVSTPSSSSHLSPLRRSQAALDARIHLAH